MDRRDFIRAGAGAFFVAAAGSAFGAGAPSNRVRLAIVGCHAVTITPETFDMLIAHPSTDVSMEGFDAAWRDRYGDRQVTDFLC